MSSRLWAFVIWAAVAATAVYWGLRLFARGAPAPAHAVAVGLPGDAPAAGADLTRLLGAAPVAAAPAAVAAPATDARFKLLGVVAPRRQGAPDGLALISVDGKPAKPVGLGGQVEGELVLLTVNHRRAELGPRGGGAQVTLELPAVPEAARGSLPSVGQSAAPVMAPAAAPAIAPPQPMGAAAPVMAAPPAPPAQQPMPPGLRGRLGPAGANSN